MRDPPLHTHNDPDLWDNLTRDDCTSQVIITVWPHATVLHHPVHFLECSYKQLPHRCQIVTVVSHIIEKCWFRPIIVNILSISSKCNGIHIICCMEAHIAVEYSSPGYLNQTRTKPPVCPPFTPPPSSFYILQNPQGSVPQSRVSIQVPSLRSPPPPPSSFNFIFGLSSIQTPPPPPHPRWDPSQLHPQCQTVSCNLLLEVSRRQLSSQKSSYLQTGRVLNHRLTIVFLISFYI